MKKEKSSPGLKLHPNIEKMRTKLEKNEVESTIINEITEHLGKCPDELLKNWTQVKKSSNSKLASMLKTGGHIDTETLKSDFPQIILFTGASGVGKTTTLVKIAAHLSLKKKKKVALITLDTFRVAAMEQIKVYSEIIGIPVNVLFKTEELKNSIENFKDKDYILIDTAGCFRDNIMKLKEIKTVLKDIPAIDTFHLISARIRYSEMMKEVKLLSELGVDKMIITKLDEAFISGPVINLSVLSGCMISYITNGQSVPDDIKVADPLNIVNDIMNAGLTYENKTPEPPSVSKFLG